MDVARSVGLLAELAGEATRRSSLSENNGTLASSSYSDELFRGSIRDPAERQPSLIHPSRSGDPDQILGPAFGRIDLETPTSRRNADQICNGFIIEGHGLSRCHAYRNLTPCNQNGKSFRRETGDQRCLGVGLIEERRASL
jgi:hypothetical protein